MITHDNARAGDTIVAEVWIAAPKSVVWSALTEAEQLRTWWGSQDTYRANEWDIDLRVGGRWMSGGTSSDGSRFNVGGEFLEVTPTDRLVMTWLPSWDAGLTSTITYTLKNEGDGTRLRMEHAGFAGREASRDNHALGWQSVLSWLGAFAERQAEVA